MKQIKVYDPNRKPKNYFELMEPHQYVVFHQHAKNGDLMLPDGSYLVEDSDYFCILCDNFAEANSYAEQKVNELPQVLCQIYDHRGKATDPVKVVVNEKQRSCFAGTTKPSKDIGWGIFFILFGCAVVVTIETIAGWTFIYGLVFGSKFLIFGFMRLLSGINKIENARPDPV